MIVRKSVLIHYCVEAVNTSRQTAARTTDVVTAIAPLVNAAATIRIQVLRAQAVTTLQEMPSVSMMRRAKSIALQSAGGKFGLGRDLQLLPAFLDRIRTADPDASAALWLGDDGIYKGWFIAPGCSVRAVATGMLRDIYTTDAAHCKGPEHGLLVGFHGFGPDDELVTIACAHIMGECADSWTWVLQNLGVAAPHVKNRDSHVITDGDKGLENAVRSCLPRAFHASCSFHRSQKLSDQTTTRPLFLKMAGAYTLEQYTSARSELESHATPASAITIDGRRAIFASHTCPLPLKKPKGTGANVPLTSASSAPATMATPLPPSTSINWKSPVAIFLNHLARLPAKAQSAMQLRWTRTRHAMGAPSNSRSFATTLSWLNTLNSDRIMRNAQMKTIASHLRLSSSCSNAGTTASTSESSARRLKLMRLELATSGM